MLQISLAIACLCTAAALALFPAFALGSVRTVHNPLFSVGADPDVVRIEHEGQTLFLLTHTVGNGEDFRQCTHSGTPRAQRNPRATNEAQL